MPEKSLAVILPTRNEGEGLEILVYALLPLLDRSCGSQYEIRIIDDSTDGSDQTLAEVFKPFAPRVSFVHREHGQGLASAIEAGILSTDREMILVMDADFNHSPLEIPPMLAASDEWLVVSGSRFLPGGGMPGRRFRETGSRIFNQFVRRALQLPTTDHLAGFFLIPRELLLEIRNRWPLFTGYGDYCIRLFAAITWMGLGIQERPTRYLSRITGESKTRFLRELARYTRTVLEIRKLEPQLRPQFERLGEFWRQKATGFLR
jgi:glycosyltransferase involved in cell wall biosynthesis